MGGKKHVNKRMNSKKQEKRTNALKENVRLELINVAASSALLGVDLGELLGILVDGLDVVLDLIPVGVQEELGLLGIVLLRDTAKKLSLGGSHSDKSFSLLGSLE